MGYFFSDELNSKFLMQTHVLVIIVIPYDNNYLRNDLLLNDKEKYKDTDEFDRNLFGSSDEVMLCSPSKVSQNTVLYCVFHNQVLRTGWQDGELCCANCIQRLRCRRFGAVT